METPWKQDKTYKRVNVRKNMERAKGVPPSAIIVHDNATLRRWGGSQVFPA
ncbi:hypothetical protein [Bartonella sp. B39]